MNEADRRAIELATLDLPLTDDDYRLMPQCSVIGQAALLLAMDDSALEAWYAGAPEPAGPISRVIARAVDRDDVADRIDAELAEDPTVLADLCRAQITWAHPGLVELLDRDAFRTCASWMLAQTDFEPLLDWLDGDRTPEELVDVARGCAGSGLPELFDALEPWSAVIAEASTQAAARLEASLFVLSPQRWGRGFLRGQFEASFLDDAVAMADLIASSGQTYWSGALAAFEPGTDEFGAIARMVAAGAAVNLHVAAEEPGRQLVDAFYGESWDVLTVHPAFSVTGALAEEDSWRRPLLESAAHDLLLARGIDTPGIGGLPLSSSHPDADEIAAARQLAAQPSVDPIVLVATMCDVQELRAVEEFRALPELFARFVDDPHPAVAATARQLAGHTTLGDDVALARRETTHGIAAAERIARRGDTDALLTLIDLWADGPVLRANWFAALVHQELRALQPIR